MLNEKDTRDELNKFELLLLVQSNTLNDLLHKIINNKLSSNLEIVTKYRYISQDIHNFLRFSLLTLKTDIDKSFNKEIINKDHYSKISFYFKKAEEDMQRLINDIKELKDKIKE